MREGGISRNTTPRRPTWAADLQHRTQENDETGKSFGHALFVFVFVFVCTYLQYTYIHVLFTC